MERVTWARAYLRQRIEQAPGQRFDTSAMHAWLTEAVGDDQAAALAIWEALDEGRLTSKPGDRMWLGVPALVGRSSTRPAPPAPPSSVPPPGNPELRRFEKRATKRKRGQAQEA